LRQLSGEYHSNNVLRASKEAWSSLLRPVTGVIVPFLEQGGQLLRNDPGALTIERIVFYLTIGTGDTRSQYETAVAALFAAMRAARKTLPADQDGAWITPNPPRRHDDDDSDDPSGAAPRRGHGSQRLP
ncbi:unnamed protein product, partial [Sphacelaria rigidula]